MIKILKGYTGGLAPIKVNNKRNVIKKEWKK